MQCYVWESGYLTQDYRRSSWSSMGTQLTLQSVGKTSLLVDPCRENALNLQSVLSENSKSNWHQGLRRPF